MFTIELLFRFSTLLFIGSYFLSISLDIGYATQVKLAVVITYVARS